MVKEREYYEGDSSLVVEGVTCRQRYEFGKDYNGPRVVDLRIRPQEDDVPEEQDDA